MKQYLAKSVPFIYFIFLIGAVSGCRTMYDATTYTRQGLLYLRLGMSREEVAAVMGSQTYTVYTPKPLSIKGFEPEEGDTYLTSEQAFTTITNPFDCKRISIDGETYDVDYYVTGCVEGVCEVTNENLTPLVYDENKLIGWGWDFLSELRGREIGVSSMPVQG